MSAEPQQPLEAPATAELAKPPSPPEATSSPIDGYATPPSPLTLPPPDQRLRSQSSGYPPSLKMASTSAAMRTRRSTVLPVNRANEEVDELDEEFDSQLPLELDSQVCERLEAESLLHRSNSRPPNNSSSLTPSLAEADQNLEDALKRSARRREQSASTPAENGTNKNKGKKRARPTSLNNTQEVIDLRFDSPEPPQPKKAKAEENGAEDGNIVPFFDENWVKHLLKEAETRGVRAESPPEKGFELSGSQMPTASQTARSNGEASSQAAVSLIDKGITLDQDQQATKQVVSSRRSSSDDDIPLALASIVASTSTIPTNTQTPAAAAINQVEKAVAELKEAYERERQVIVGKLVEKDLLIDQLRAKLRKRPSKTGSPQETQFAK